jgi:3-isopropylmalate/(R)-2-methylmalate dehydratase large subunit
MKIVLDGDLPPGVTAKDFALRVIGDLGADGGLYRSVEFHGNGIAGMSLESRMVLPNMMAEFGAKNAWVAPDEKTMAYLGERLQRRLGDSAMKRMGDYGIGVDPITQSRSLASSQSLLPDPDALYAAEHRYHAADLEPYVACPHSVDNVVPLGQVAGTRIQQAFLGTCTNGRIEDLAAAAAVIRGKQVAAGVRFLVIPASSQVLREALALGLIQDFVEAGAVIGVPGCGPCMGNHMGIPAPGEVTISSANRNFRGRMGTADAEIYLANPAVVAASAVAGVIAGPREIGE